MAKVIEFYVPNNFRRRLKWVSPEQRGRVIEFGSWNALAGPCGPGACEVNPPLKPALEKAVLY